MSKEKTLTNNPSTRSTSGAGSMLAELFHAGVYKPTQGKIVRQVTCVALIGFVALACYNLMQSLESEQGWSMVQYPLPIALGLIGAWICYRAVNVPRFADFLIAVQAEMNKVSWPSQQELTRSSIVVIVMIILLATVLFGFDMFWTTLFKFIGILKH